MAKIMQINITCGKGSTGEISAHLYQAVKECGDESRFAFASFEPTISGAFRIENILQHYFRRGMNKYCGKRQIYSTPGTKRLIRYIRREKPDLIHVHNVQQNSLNYIVFFNYLKRSGIPVVYTLHDCWSFTGGCYYFSRRKCDKYIRGECGRCIEDLDDVTYTAGEAYDFKHKLIGNNDNIHIVCVSNWLRDVANKSYMKFMKHSIEVFYNGVDTKVFCPRESTVREELGIKKDEFVVLGVASNWEERKGLRYFDLLCTKLPDEYKVILVGHGLETVRAKYEKCICIDHTESREKLAEVYSSADVYINMSLEETFGLTTTEALACGTPAIVFNTTACPEIVNVDSGICIDYTDNTETDIKSILSAIYEIKGKGKKSYTKACIERVQAKFSLTKMIENYLILYRRVLGEKQL